MSWGTSVVVVSLLWLGVWHWLPLPGIAALVRNVKASAAGKTAKITAYVMTSLKNVRF
jgi:hypothetical protein